MIFPAYEIYIGNERIYEYDPIAAGEELLALGGELDKSIPNTKLNQPIP